MSTKLQPVRGTKDLFASDYRLFLHVVNTARNIAINYGFDDLATPIFEFADVFRKTLGEETDVVTKEMYTFLDKGGEEITLRPEFTAGICRAFISNGYTQHLPLRLFSHGPLFRYERPQKGRQRQFHQINAEILGIKSPMLDAEIIIMASQILEKLGISESIQLNLNSLGDKETRKIYRDSLTEYYRDHINSLSEDSKVRLQKNPLRILDSKDENDKKINLNAPRISEFYNQESNDYYAALKELLTLNAIKFTENPSLVRGLDYYEHTIFEFITDALGAQGTVIGGGRYDGLIETMGGPPTPAIGFAGGIERLMELVDFKNFDANVLTVTIIAIGERAEKESLAIATILRNNNIRVILPYQNQVGKKFKYADKINAKIAIVIGEEELEKNVAKIKNMLTGSEEIISIDNLLDKLGQY
ncbi:MAG: histidine--tRNA ligase [Sphingobacteriia bacterium]|nr:histidine--tRNA ligase [Sphingobacteriia bacterium]